MALHLATLIEREGSGFFEQAGRETNLPDVVDQPAEMGERLLIFGQSHPAGNVSGIDSDRGGMTSRVAISSVERGDQTLGE
jgi:hypothetical protein